jgi:hypothetical protein
MKRIGRGNGLGHYSASCLPTTNRVLKNKHQGVSPSEMACGFHGAGKTRGDLESAIPPKAG